VIAKLGRARLRWRSRADEREAPRQADEEGGRCHGEDRGGEEGLLDVRGDHAGRDAVVAEHEGELADLREAHPGQDGEPG